MGLRTITACGLHNEVRDLLHARPSDTGWHHADRRVGGTEEKLLQHWNGGSSRHPHWFLLGFQTWRNQGVILSSRWRRISALPSKLVLIPDSNNYQFLMKQQIAQPTHCHDFLQTLLFKELSSALLASIESYKTFMGKLSVQNFFYNHRENPRWSTLAWLTKAKLSILARVAATSPGADS